MVYRYRRADRAGDQFRYLNQRIFCHDALADHASRDELHALNIENRRKLYLLGLFTGGVSICASD